MSDKVHIPSQSVSEDAKMRTVAFYAPSKTFNLAGLIGSYHIVFNKTLKDRLDKEPFYKSQIEIRTYCLHPLIKTEWIIKRIRRSLVCLQREVLSRRTNNPFLLKG